MVGEWVEVRQSILDHCGVYAQLGVRKQLSDKLADNLGGVEVVAVFTNVS